MKNLSGSDATVENGLGLIINWPQGVKKFIYSLHYLILNAGQGIIQNNKATKYKIFERIIFFFLICEDLSNVILIWFGR